jgi:Xaa-Pro aminopeptidase/Xaa-Pro dipeptidase
MSSSISTPEYEQRLANVRLAMGKRGLDALLVFSLRRSQVAYISGYRPNYYSNCGLVLVPLERPPILWIRFGFDLNRARSLCWFDDIRTSPSYDLGAVIADATAAIRSLGVKDPKLGLVSADAGVDELGVSTYQALRAALPEASFELASDIFNDLRLLKSPAEIEKLRAAAELADAVAESLGKALRPGETECVACAAAEQTARRLGADCSLWISSDLSRMALPARPFEFRAGSTVICEFTVGINGYWAQICRTYSLGKPSPDQQEVFRVCRNAYAAIVAAAQPGVRVATLAETGYNTLAAGGCADLIPYGYGHGVGLENTEQYSIEPGCQARLASSMALISHPAIFVRGRGAAWVGGPFVVNANGNIPLDKPQQKIFEVY